MEDTNIEILDTENVIGNGTAALPVNFVPVGNIKKDNVQVYIKQDVYKQIEKFSKEDTKNEVGSILIGKYIAEEYRYTVIISDFIEAKYTDASAATLTFTHETWNYVWNEKDAEYPDKTIVGWQHTHPDYGIFLSEYDLFIQKNFFNFPWQIAYVVDPLADTRGFFQWKNGEISELNGFYVYDEVGEEIKIAKGTKPAKKRISFLTILLAFLLIASAFLAVSFGIEKNSVAERLEEALDFIEQQNKIPPDAPTITQPVLPDDVETFKVYIIKPGDSLEGICKKHSLNYAENIQTILQINSIIDANKIYAGQKLYLPMGK